MGTKLYDFLTESFIFDGSRYEESFSGFTDDAIVSELQRYREFCLSNLDALTVEALDAGPVLRVFTGRNEVGLQTLKQSAFYIQQYVLPDPLFPFTAVRSQTSDAMASYLGYEKSGLDREDLIRVLRYLKTVTPMVAADYVKFLPVSKLFEAPENLPMYYSENQFSDVLPKDVLAFLQKRAIVRSLA